MEELGMWCLILGVIGLVIQSAVKSANKGNPSTPPPLPIDRQISKPVVVDGPGHFTIVGVDRATKMDTTWHCDAASEANARAKADLEGILVTGIKRSTKTQNTYP